MWSPCCWCCSPMTVQQDNPRRELLLSSTRCARYCRCNRCGSTVCDFCVRGFIQEVEKRTLPQDDVSIVSLYKMSESFLHQNTDVNGCICCAFSNGIQKTVRSNLDKPPKASPIVDSEDDKEFSPDVNRTLRKSMKRQKRNEDSCTHVNFLYEYYKESTRCRTKPLNIDKILYLINKSRKKKHKRVYEPNYFDGATVIAEFNLLICAEATSMEWQADHSALAESNMDRTPAVLHAVVSSDSAKIVKRFMQANKCLPRGIEGDQELLKLTVESPLDPMKKLVLNICVITIDQCYSSVTVSSWKGKPASDPRILSNMMMFRNKDVQ